MKSFRNKMSHFLGGVIDWVVTGESIFRILLSIVWFCYNWIRRSWHSMTFQQLFNVNSHCGTLCDRRRLFLNLILDNPEKYFSVFHVVIIVILVAVPGRALLMALPSAGFTPNRFIAKPLETEAESKGRVMVLKLGSSHLVYLGLLWCME